jgi:hypothetical protein
MDCRFTPPSPSRGVTGKAGQNRNAKAGLNVVHTFERTSKGQNICIDKNRSEQARYN